MLEIVEFFPVRFLCLHVRQIGSVVGQFELHASEKFPKYIVFGLSAPNAALVRLADYTATWNLPTTEISKPWRVSQY